MVGDLLAARNISVSIARSHRDVYEFVVDPRNLGRWASGVGARVEQIDGQWVATTPEGPVTLRFVARNALGVLDHHVRLPSGVEIYVPIRVIPNGAGSELVLTLFRQPEMTDEKFEADAAWVGRDLEALKTLLEAGA